MRRMIERLRRSGGEGLGVAGPLPLVGRGRGGGGSARVVTSERGTEKRRFISTTDGGRRDDPHPLPLPTRGGFRQRSRSLGLTLGGATTLFVTLALATDAPSPGLATMRNDLTAEDL